MDFRPKQTSPVLVIGMHRSGTRLLDEILNGLGVFMGADRQADGESVTFMLINETIFHQCGTFWNEPLPVHFVLSDPALLERVVALAHDALTARFENYLGQQDAKLRQVAGDAAPFGWKDPRNTFTLPVWRQIFPEARVIHVLRHGVDAAASLAQRHGAALRAATGEALPPALTVIRDHGLGVLSSRRGWNLAEAFTMWEQYVEKARLESAELGDRALEIRFEDLLRRPEELIATIARFCGVDVPEGLQATLPRIDASRAFAYRQDPTLLAFAQSSREALGRYGYTP
jgi:Sulfotransferase family